MPSAHALYMCVFDFCGNIQIVVGFLFFTCFEMITVSFQFSKNDNGTIVAPKPITNSKPAPPKKPLRQTPKSDMAGQAQRKSRSSTQFPDGANGTVFLGRVDGKLSEEPGISEVLFNTNRDVCETKANDSMSTVRSKSPKKVANSSKVSETRNFP